MFCRREPWYRIATRCDKLAINRRCRSPRGSRELVAIIELGA